MKSKMRDCVFLLVKDSNHLVLIVVVQGQGNK